MCLVHLHGLRFFAAQLLRDLKASYIAFRPVKPAQDARFDGTEVVDVKRALVWVERVPETFLKSSQAASLHKLQESTAPRLCTSRERGFGSNNSLRRSRSLYRLQHVSLHQLQQGWHRVVLAKQTQAELCKLGVC